MPAEGETASARPIRAKAGKPDPIRPQDSGGRTVPFPRGEFAGRLAPVMARVLAVVSGLGFLLAACAGSTPAASGPESASAVGVTPSPSVAPPSPAPAEPGPSSPPVTYLVDEGKFVMHADGRVEQTFVAKYRINRPEALESGFSTVEATWAPWFQRRPVLDVRVKTPSGRVVTLDPSTVEESGVGGSDPLMYSDQRTLRAALPGLTVGSVVEIRRELVDERPMFAGGRAPRFQVGGWIPIARSELVVEAPESTPLRYVVRGIELEPEVSVEGGTRRLVFRADDLAALPTPESSTPPDVIPYPYVEVSVATGWGQIATAYHEAVAERVAGAQLAGFPNPPPGGSRRNAVRTLAAAIHAKVRYTGLELGQRALVPEAPDTITERGYGDCKDKATLLVALLERAGIPARVALIRSGYTAEVPREVPSIDQFNHAIVYVPGEPPLWVDATNPKQPVDEVPYGLDEKLALIADPDTEALVRLPARPTSANVYRERRIIELRELSAPRVTEVMSGVGPRGQALRDTYESATETEIKQALAKYFESTYAAKTIDAVVREGGGPSNAPFSVRVTASRAPRLELTDDRLEIPLEFGAVFDDIPRSAVADEPRKHPLYQIAPYRSELEHEVRLPRGFAVVESPKPQVRQLGPVTLERTVSESDGVVRVRHVLDSGPRRWTAEQVAAFAEAAEGLEVTDLLVVEHRTATLRARGRYAEAVEAHRSALAAEPDDAAERVRFALTLLDTRLGELARDEAKRATELAPDHWWPWFVLGLARMADPLGRDFGPGSDREGALAAFRRAKALAPDNPAPALNLAVVAEHDPLGQQFGPEADHALALAEYESIRESGWDLNELGYGVNYRLALLRAGQWERATEAAEAAAADETRSTHWVAATAMARSTSAAVRLAEQLPERYGALVSAGQLLHMVGQRDRGMELIERARSEFDLRTQKALGSWLRMKPRAALLAEVDGPQRATLGFAAAWLEVGARPAGERLRPFIHPELEATLAASDGPMVVHPLRETLMKPLGEDSRGLMTRSLFDAYLNDRRTQVFGDAEGGWLVRLPPKDSPTYAVSYFLLEHEGTPQVRALSVYPAEIARVVLQAALRGDDGLARRWMGWLRSDGGVGSARAHALLPPPSPSPSEAEIAVDAALLLVKLDPGARALARRAVERFGPELPASQRQKTLLARFELAAAAGDGAGMARWLSELRDLPGTVPERLAELEARHLRSTGQWEALISHIEGRGSSEAGELKAAYLRGSGLADWSAALEAFERRDAESALGAGELNNYAWMLHCAGTEPRRALKLAERAAEASQYESRATLHTLAAAYADAGEPKLAMTALEQAVDRSHGWLQPHDAYVLGRVAEHYGLTDAAIRYYRRIQRPAVPVATSTWSLARRRLKALRADPRR